MSRNTQAHKECSYRNAKCCGNCVNYSIFQQDNYVSFLCNRENQKGLTIMPTDICRYFATGLQTKMICEHEFGSFIDPRDGREYKTIKIGELEWFAENLKFECKNEDGTVKNKRYDGKDRHLRKYGGLYDWEMANTVCPSGWHLPTAKEWKVLVEAAGGHYAAGRCLKARRGWNRFDEKSGSGTDKLGFGALPGGCFVSNQFDGEGYDGHWWSASEYTDANMAYSIAMSYSSDAISERDTHNKKEWLSVRCVRDY